ncbi:MGMT family protein [Bacillus sp. REN3]|uniref:MGMT family protein n=1 Tax=Bacillus sp. REN3 TaxID=2802440 RepID=UPI001AEE6351|nr:MGMT family protein [Bacillus sp. REN3]
MENFTKEVINIISGIPAGRVMTYGQIARLAGSPKAARQVVRVLHSMSEKHHLPWHRVLNSKGQIGFKEQEMYINQKLMLEAEGIVFDNSHTLSLEQYNWEPSNPDIKP